MGVVVSSHGHVGVVEFHPLRPHVAAGELGRTVLALCQNGTKRILIDLGRVRLATTPIIGDIASALQHALDEGASIYLCNIGRQVEYMLTTTKLRDVLSVVGDRTAGVLFLSGLDVQARPDCFAFHSSSVQRLTADLSYLWSRGEGPLLMTQGEHRNTGRSVLRVFDPDGAEVVARDSRDASASRARRGLAGRAGQWRVDLDLVDYSGTLDLEMRNL